MASTLFTGLPVSYSCAVCVTGISLYFYSNKILFTARLFYSFTSFTIYNLSRMQYYRLRLNFIAPRKNSQATLEDKLHEEVGKPPVPAAVLKFWSH